jgi:hypothetical protein
VAGPFLYGEPGLRCAIQRFFLEIRVGHVEGRLDKQPGCTGL